MQHGVVYATSYSKVRTTDPYCVSLKVWNVSYEGGGLVNASPDVTGPGEGWAQSDNPLASLVGTKVQVCYGLDPYNPTCTLVHYAGV